MSWRLPYFARTILAGGLALGAGAWVPPADAQAPRLDEAQVDTREVWVKPIVTGGVENPDETVLKQRLQEGLDYFTQWSAGRLQVKVTRVAPVVRSESGACNGSIAVAGHPAEYQGSSVPEGTHVLTAVFGPCYTTSLAPAGKGNWLFVAGLNPKDPEPQRTAIHEFGHNLGLGHANSTTCHAQSFAAHAATLSKYAECPEEEYGDSSSLMGSGRLDDSDDLGAPAMLQLGWLGSEIVAESGENTYELRPYKAGQDNSVIVLPDGYTLSYRAPDQSHSFVEGAGVYLHDVDPPKDPPKAGYLPRSSSILVPMTPFIDAAQTGMHVLLPGSTVAFHVLSMTQDSARVRVIVDDSGVQDTWGPSTLAPMRVGRTPTVKIDRCEGQWRVRTTWAAYDPAGVARAQLELGSQLVNLGVPKGEAHYPGSVEAFLSAKPRGAAALRVWDTLGNEALHSMRLRILKKCMNPTAYGNS